MNTAAAFLVAFGGGIVSFASPCVLPLVPVYLALVSGFDLAGDEPRQAAVIVRDTVLFVAGFTAVFVALGTTASALGATLLADHVLITRLAGLLIVAMAVFLVAAPLAGRAGLMREWRLPVRPRRWGRFAAPAAGLAFGFGWTPCIGPVLASVLTVAATRGRTGQGAALLAAYSLGLGIPFLAAGALLGHTQRPLAWLRRRAQLVTFASASLLGGLGLLLMLGQFSAIDSVLGGL